MDVHQILKMEVNIVSREMIKPSSSTHNLKPYNLCLLDQLMPPTYVPIVLFYPVNNIPDPNFDISKTITQLKKSLSETLNLYYPYSGRTKHNLYTDDYFSGVLFLEARVKFPMSEFFERSKVDDLCYNQLLPFRPLCRENTFDVIPIAFQVNTFSCGGIALGISLCHNNSDATMLSNFLKSWAAFSNGDLEKVINPNLCDAAILFPQKTDNFLEKYTSMMDRLWFNEGDFTTRKFVFRTEAIETLKERAKTERVPTPSRNFVVSCFIWKHATEASWAVSGSPRPSLASHAVNIRPRMKESSLDGATGNLFWWAMAVFDPNDGNVESASSTDVELSELVDKLKEAMDGFEEDFICEVTKGNKEGSCEVLSQLELMSSTEVEKPDVFAFSNWKGFFNEVDFGFGKPYSIGSVGKVGSACRNTVIMVDADRWGKGSVEAVITLEDKRMAFLECDSSFLAFASPI
ncbi:stemmadenine O-acetyltransferase-like [Humulus lupulus]|uniref:stemmadenine O-acetyltransferase-like n=1 Tax=Humulus lupulus TaxID=3486 RepID=UPI002B417474|nr:stemmadenine O-acetyltransferase-like [Humulus lupulus]